MPDDVLHRPRDSRPYLRLRALGRAAALSLLLAASGCAHAAPAETTTSLRWGSTPAQVVTTGLYVGGLLGVWAIGEPEQPRWSRPNRFDAGLTDALGRGEGPRHALGLTSDLLVVAAIAYPVLVEDLGLVLFGHDDPRLAGRLVAIDAQAFALSGLVVGVTKVASARQRPYADALGCAADPAQPGCLDDRNMSFMSGHSALAFTGAGLACFHQQQIDRLYPSLAATVGVCASGMALATVTASLRVMAEKHWTSDVLVGAGVGLLAGWLLPHLSHGRPILSVGGDAARASFAPLWGERGELGVQVTGTF
jgi:membrane-associated phospholipid phosphatase